MKKVAILGDSHYKESSRFDECKNIHDWIAEDCAERKVDLVCHAGDLYDGKSQPKERHAVADFVKRVTDRCPLVIVRGNHDVIGDLSLLGRLETKHPVVVEESCGVHTVAGMTIACMAWPRKAELMASHAVLTTANVDINTAAQDLLRNVLRGFAASIPQILLAHAMVRGSKTSTGQELVGCDFELGLEDLALSGAPFIALGHIHKAQEWYQSGTTPAIMYTGSPRRTNFGETEEKSYVIAEFEGSEFLSFERITTPTTPLITIDAEWTDYESIRGYLITRDPFPEVKGAEVRLRYEVSADHREIAKEQSETMRDKLIYMGAVACKVEEIVQPSVKARLPEITTAQSIEEKLRMFWTSKDDLPNEERIASLFSKVRELESEQ